MREIREYGFSRSLARVCDSALSMFHTVFSFRVYIGARERWIFAVRRDVTYVIDVGETVALEYRIPSVFLFSLTRAARRLIGQHIACSAARGPSILLLGRITGADVARRNSRGNYTLRLSASARESELIMST